MNYRHVAAWLAFCALVMFAQASIFPFTIVSHRAFNSKFIELEVDMVISKVDEASKTYLYNALSMEMKIDTVTSGCSPQALKFDQSAQKLGQKILNQTHNTINGYEVLHGLNGNLLTITDNALKFGYTSKSTTINADWDYKVRFSKGFLLNIAYPVGNLSSYIKTCFSLSVRRSKDDGALPSLQPFLIVENRHPDSVSQNLPQHAPPTPEAFLMAYVSNINKDNNKVTILYSLQFDDTCFETTVLSIPTQLKALSVDCQGACNHVKYNSTTLKLTVTLDCSTMTSTSFSLSSSFVDSDTTTIPILFSQTYDSVYRKDSVDIASAYAIHPSNSMLSVINHTWWLSTLENLGKVSANLIMNTTTSRDKNYIIKITDSQQIMMMPMCEGWNINIDMSGEFIATKSTGEFMITIEEEMNPVTVNLELFYGAARIPIGNQTVFVPPVQTEMFDVGCNFTLCHIPSHLLSNLTVSDLVIQSYDRYILDATVGFNVTFTHPNKQISLSVAPKQMLSEQLKTSGGSFTIAYSKTRILPAMSVSFVFVKGMTVFNGTMTTLQSPGNAALTIAKSSIASESTLNLEIEYANFVRFDEMYDNFNITFSLVASNSSDIHFDSTCSSVLVNPTTSTPCALKDNSLKCSMHALNGLSRISYTFNNCLVFDSRRRGGMIAVTINSTVPRYDEISFTSMSTLQLPPPQPQLLSIDESRIVSCTNNTCDIELDVDAANTNNTCLFADVIASSTYLWNLTLVVPESLTRVCSQRGVHDCLSKVIVSVPTGVASFNPIPLVLQNSELSGHYTATWPVELIQDICNSASIFRLILKDVIMPLPTTVAYPLGDLTLTVHQAGLQPSVQFTHLLLNKRVDTHTNTTTTVSITPNQIFQLDSTQVWTFNVTDLKQGEGLLVRMSGCSVFSSGVSLPQSLNNGTTSLLSLGAEALNALFISSRELSASTSPAFTIDGISCYKLLSNVMQISIVDINYPTKTRSVVRTVPFNVVNSLTDLNHKVSCSMMSKPSQDYTSYFEAHIPTTVFQGITPPTTSASAITPVTTRTTEFYVRYEENPPPLQSNTMSSLRCRTSFPTNILPGAEIVVSLSAGWRPTGTTSVGMFTRSGSNYESNQLRVKLSPNADLIRANTEIVFEIKSILSPYVEDVHLDKQIGFEVLFQGVNQHTFLSAITSFPVDFTATPFPNAHLVSNIAFNLDNTVNSLQIQFVMSMNVNPGDLIKIDLKSSSGALSSNDITSILNFSKLSSDLSTYRAKLFIVRNTLVPMYISPVSDNSYAYYEPGVHISINITAVNKINRPTLKDRLLWTTELATQYDKSWQVTRGYSYSRQNGLPLVGSYGDENRATYTAVSQYNTYPYMTQVSILMSRNSLFNSMPPSSVMDPAKDEPVAGGINNYGTSVVIATSSCDLYPWFFNNFLYSSCYRIRSSPTEPTPITVPRRLDYRPSYETYGLSYLASPSPQDHTYSYSLLTPSTLTFVAPFGELVIAPESTVQSMIVTHNDRLVISGTLSNHRPQLCWYEIKINFKTQQVYSTPVRPQFQSQNCINVADGLYDEIITHMTVTPDGFNVYATTSEGRIYTFIINQSTLKITEIDPIPFEPRFREIFSVNDPMNFDTRATNIKGIISLSTYSQSPLVIVQAVHGFHIYRRAFGRTGYLQYDKYVDVSSHGVTTIVHNRPELQVFAVLTRSNTVNVYYSVNGAVSLIYTIRCPGIPTAASFANPFVKSRLIIAVHSFGLYSFDINLNSWWYADLKQYLFFSQSSVLTEDNRLYKQSLNADLTPVVTEQVETCLKKVNTVVAYPNGRYVSATCEYNTTTYIYTFERQGSSDIFTLVNGPPYTLSAPIVGKATHTSDGYHTFYTLHGGRFAQVDGLPLPSTIENTSGPSISYQYSSPLYSSLRMYALPYSVTDQLESYQDAQSNYFKSTSTLYKCLSVAKSTRFYGYAYKALIATPDTWSPKVKFSAGQSSSNTVYRILEIQVVPYSGDDVLVDVYGYLYSMKPYDYTIDVSLPPKSTINFNFALPDWLMPPTSIYYLRWADLSYLDVTVSGLSITIFPPTPTTNTTVSFPTRTFKMTLRTTIKRNVSPIDSKVSGYVETDSGRSPTTHLFLDTSLYQSVTGGFLSARLHQPGSIALDQTYPLVARIKLQDTLRRSCYYDTMLNTVCFNSSLSKTTYNTTMLDQVTVTPPNLSIKGPFQVTFNDNVGKLYVASGNKVFTVYNERIDQDKYTPTLKFASAGICSSNDIIEQDFIYTLPGANINTMKVLTEGYKHGYALAIGSSRGLVFVKIDKSSHALKLSVDTPSSIYPEYNFTQVFECMPTSSDLLSRRPIVYAFTSTNRIARVSFSSLYLNNGISELTASSWSILTTAYPGIKYAVMTPTDDFYGVTFANVLVYISQSYISQAYPTVQLEINVKTMALHPDGKTIVFGGDDARLHSVQVSGSSMVNCTRTRYVSASSTTAERGLNTTFDSITSVSFSASGERLFVTGVGKDKSPLYEEVVMAPLIPYAYISPSSLQTGADVNWTLELKFPRLDYSIGSILRIEVGLPTNVTIPTTCYVVSSTQLSIVKTSCLNSKVYFDVQLTDARLNDYYYYFSLQGDFRNAPNLYGNLNDLYVGVLRPKFISLSSDIVASAGYYDDSFEMIAQTYNMNTPGLNTVVLLKRTDTGNPPILADTPTSYEFSLTSPAILQTQFFVTPSHAECRVSSSEFGIYTNITSVDLKINAKSVKFYSKCSYTSLMTSTTTHVSFTASSNIGHTFTNITTAPAIIVSPIFVAKFSSSEYNTIVIYDVDIPATTTLTVNFTMLYYPNVPLQYVINIIDIDTPVKCTFANNQATFTATFSTETVTTTMTCATSSRTGIYFTYTHDPSPSTAKYTSYHDTSRTIHVLGVMSFDQPTDQEVYSMVVDDVALHTVTFKPAFLQSTPIELSLMRNDAELLPEDPETLPEDLKNTTLYRCGLSLSANAESFSPQLSLTIPAQESTISYYIKCSASVMVTDNIYVQATVLDITALYVRSRSPLVTAYVTAATSVYTDFNTFIKQPSSVSVAYGLPQLLSVNISSTFIHTTSLLLQSSKAGKCVMNTNRIAPQDQWLSTLSVRVPADIHVFNMTWFMCLQHTSAIHATIYISNDPADPNGGTIAPFSLNNIHVTRQLRLRSTENNFGDFYSDLIPTIDHPLFVHMSSIHQGITVTVSSNICLIRLASRPASEGENMIVLTIVQFKLVSEQLFVRCSPGVATFTVSQIHAVEIFTDYTTAPVKISGALELYGRNTDGMLLNMHNTTLKVANDIKYELVLKMKPAPTEVATISLVFTENGFASCSFVDDKGQSVQSIDYMSTATSMEASSLTVVAHLLCHEADAIGSSIHVSYNGKLLIYDSSVTLPMFAQSSMGVEIIHSMGAEQSNLFTLTEYPIRITLKQPPTNPEIFMVTSPFYPGVCVFKAVDSSSPWNATASIVVYPSSSNGPRDLFVMMCLRTRNQLSSVKVSVASQSYSDESSSMSFRLQGRFRHLIGLSDEPIEASHTSTHGYLQINDTLRMQDHIESGLISTAVSATYIRLARGAFTPMRIEISPSATTPVGVQLHFADNRAECGFISDTTAPHVMTNTLDVKFNQAEYSIDYYVGCLYSVDDPVRVVAITTSGDVYLKSPSQPLRVMGNINWSNTTLTSIVAFQPYQVYLALSPPPQARTVLMVSSPCQYSLSLNGFQSNLNMDVSANAAGINVYMRCHVYVPGPIVTNITVVKGGYVDALSTPFSIKYSMSITEQGTSQLPSTPTVFGRFYAKRERVVWVNIHPTPADAVTVSVREISGTCHIVDPAEQDSSTRYLASRDITFPPNNSSIPVLVMCDKDAYNRPPSSEVRLEVKHIADLVQTHVSPIITVGLDLQPSFKLVDNIPSVHMLDATKITLNIIPQPSVDSNLNVTLNDPDHICSLRSSEISSNEMSLVLGAAASDNSVEFWMYCTQSTMLNATLIKPTISYSFVDGSYVWPLSHQFSVVFANCGDAPTLPNMSNVVYTSGGFGVKRYQSTARYECSLGYDLALPGESITCSPQGWSKSDQLCNLHNCGAPTSTVQHSQITVTPGVNGEKYYYKSNITYTCDLGFDMVDSSQQNGVRQCGATGWTPLTPSSCVPHDCKATALMDGRSVSYTDGEHGPHKFGSVASFTCGPGFEPISIDSVSTCTSTGWTPIEAECHNSRCKLFADVPFGAIKYTKDSEVDPSTQENKYPLNTEVILTCQSGYTAKTTDAITCLKTGWSTTDPQCVRVKCRGLPITHGTIVQSDPSQPNTYGTSITYSCDEGYLLNTTDIDVITKTCEPDASNLSSGKWSNMINPTCNVHKCNQPPITNATSLVKTQGHENLDISFGATWTYSCDQEGQELIGSPTQTCRLTGWTETVTPYCRFVRCGNYAGFANGRVIYEDPLQQFNSFAELTCNNGYTLVSAGIPTTTTVSSRCLKERLWSEHGQYQCKPQLCSTLPNIGNGTLTFTSTLYQTGTVATYTCIPGFKLVDGSTTRTCQGTANGWSGKEPKCVDIDECTDPNFLINCGFYGEKSRCVNTIGSYVCTPYIIDQSMSMSSPSGTGMRSVDGHIIRLESITNQYILFDVFPGVHITNAINEVTLHNPTLVTVGCVLEPVTNSPRLLPNTEIQLLRVKCKVDAGQGSGYLVRLRYCFKPDIVTNVDFVDCSRNNTDDAPQANYNYQLNYPMIEFVSTTLRSLTKKSSPTNTYLADYRDSEEMAIAVKHLYVEKPAFVSLSFGPAYNPSKYALAIDLTQTMQYQDSIIFKTIVPNNNSTEDVDMVFKLTIMDYTAYSTDTFSYPLPMIVTSITGCQSQGSHTISKCRTTGGDLVTVTGDNFLAPLSVTVNTKKFTIVERTNTQFTFLMNAGVGVEMTLRIISGSATYTIRKAISYAAPTILSVSGCGTSPDNEHDTVNCPRYGGSYVTVTGYDFGQSGSTINLGGKPCLNAVHDAHTPHHVAYCTTPTGFNKDLRVNMLQKFGESSTSNVMLSYIQCPPGKFNDGFLCSDCPIGTHNDATSQDMCKPCVAGTFSNSTGTVSCSVCPAGTYSSFGDTSCTKCRRGTFSLGNAAMCIQCSPGTYSADEGATSCPPCSLGATNTDDFSACQCQIGHYMTQQGSCVSCMRGGNCTKAGTDVFNVKSLKNFIASVPIKDSESVVRLNVVLANKVLNTAQVSSVTTLLLKMLFDEGDIPRSRVRIHEIRPSQQNIRVVTNTTYTNTTQPLHTHQIDSSNIVKSPIALDYYSHLGASMKLTHHMTHSPRIVLNPLNVTTTYQLSDVAIVTIDVLPSILDDVSVNVIASKIIDMFANPTSYLRILLGNSFVDVPTQAAYTRHAVNSFQECLTKACVGDEKCSEGHTGNLCAVCEFGYGKTGVFKCSKCNDVGLRTFYLILTIIGAVVFCAILAGRQIYDGRKATNELPAPAIPLLFKITMSGFQTMAIAARYDLRWPGILAGFFATTDTAAGVDTAIVSLDCFLPQGFPMNPFWVTCLGTMLLPFAGIIIPAIVFFPQYLKARVRYQKELGDAVLDNKRFVVQIHREYVEHVRTTSTTKMVELFAQQQVGDHATNIYEEQVKYIPDHEVWIQKKEAEKFRNGQVSTTESTIHIDTETHDQPVQLLNIDDSDTKATTIGDSEQLSHSNEVEIESSNDTPDWSDGRNDVSPPPKQKVARSKSRKLTKRSRNEMKIMRSFTVNDSTHYVDRDGNLAARDDDSEDDHPDVIPSGSHLTVTSYSIRKPQVDQSARGSVKVKTTRSSTPVPVAKKGRISTTQLISGSSHQSKPGTPSTHVRNTSSPMVMRPVSAISRQTTVPSFLHSTSVTNSQQTTPWSAPQQVMRLSTVSPHSTSYQQSPIQPRRQLAPLSQQSINPNTYQQPIRPCFIQHNPVNTESNRPSHGLVYDYNNVHLVNDSTSNRSNSDESTHDEPYAPPHCPPNLTPTLNKNKNLTSRPRSKGYHVYQPHQQHRPCTPASSVNANCFNYADMKQTQRQLHFEDDIDIDKYVVCSLIDDPLQVVYKADVPCRQPEVDNSCEEAQKVVDDLQRIKQMYDETTFDDKHDHEDAELDIQTGFEHDMFSECFNSDETVRKQEQDIASLVCDPLLVVKHAYTEVDMRSPTSSMSEVQLDESIRKIGKQIHYVCEMHRDQEAAVDRSYRDNDNEMMKDYLITQYGVREGERRYKRYLEDAPIGKLTALEMRQKLALAESRLNHVRSEYLGYFITTVTVVLTMIYPNIARQFFMMMSCKSIGEDAYGKFALGDMSEPCYSPQHRLFIFTIGFPILILWVIGIPFFSFYILYSNRELIMMPTHDISTVMRQRKQAFQSQMAFLYRGYVPSRYYWFLMEMFRKVSLVAVVVFFPGALHTQLLMACIIIFFCTLAQVAAKPFENPIVEYAEFASLGTSFMVFYLANFLFIDSLSEFEKELVTYIILAFVAFFVVYVTVGFIRLTRDELDIAPLRRRIQAGHAFGHNIEQIMRQWRIEHAQRKMEVATEHAIKDETKTNVVVTNEMVVDLNPVQESKFKGTLYNPDRDELIATIETTHVESVSFPLQLCDSSDEPSGDGVVYEDDGDVMRIRYCS